MKEEEIFNSVISSAIEVLSHQSLHVIAEARSLREGLSTHFTRVRPCPCVDPGMGLQGRRLTKGLAANLAAEGTKTLVAAGMGDKGCLGKNENGVEMFMAGLRLRTIMEVHRP